MANFAFVETAILHHKNILHVNDAIIQDQRRYFVLTDDRVFRLCYPLLPNLKSYPCLVIPQGEKEKSLENCQAIWNFLLENNADRKSVLILLGGGVMLDMGGFAASVYQRGISTIYIPTTLLSMADAAIGGKTAVNFLQYKNFIGSFYPPESTHICPDFLKTLSESDLLNGWAEMLKHGIIADATHFDRALQFLQGGLRVPPTEMVYQTASIKNKIVKLDPFENGLRKKLNAGHTIGHAIEEFYISKNREIGHGHAVAIGLYLESWIAAQMQILGQAAFEKIKELTEIYAPVNFSREDMPQLVALCLKDKKNLNGQILMVLAENIGHVQIDIPVSREQILNALETYYDEFIA